jgi:hypothetical protein
VEFNRPGEASIFKPRAGIVQECNTSVEEINKVAKDFIGSHMALSVSSRRKIFFLVGVINESNSKLKKFEYSYDQYHW